MSEPDDNALAPMPEAKLATIERSLTRLDKLAHLMDEQFRLPVINYRVGLDPIIGVVPGGGDWATWCVGAYIFWEALRLDAPRAMLARMAWHLGVDLVAGYVPGVGDAFDAAYKANRKNVDLLLDYYGVTRVDQTLRLPADLPAHIARRQKRSRFLRYIVGIGVILVLMGIAAVPFLVLWWLIGSG
jgi:hypothetical protein